MQKTGVSNDQMNYSTGVDIQVTHDEGAFMFIDNDSKVNLDFQ